MSTTGIPEWVRELVTRRPERRRVHQPPYFGERRTSDRRGTWDNGPEHRSVNR